MNEFTLSGRGVKISGVKTSPRGTKMVTLRIINQEHRGKDLYVNVDVWGEEAVEKLLSRDMIGRPVVTKGELHINTWKDKVTGEPKSSTYLVAKSIKFDAVEEEEKPSDDQMDQLYYYFVKMKGVNPVLTKTLWDQSQHESFSAKDATAMIRRMVTICNENKQMALTSGFENYEKGTYE